MNRTQEIYNYIKNKGEVSPIMLRAYFKLSRAMVHRHLNSLLADGSIVKLGQPPKTTYRVNYNYEQYLRDERWQTLDNDGIHITTREYLDKVLKHKIPYIVDVFGEDILIFPGVMSPAYDWSPFFLIDNLPENLSDKTVLEIGSASGVVSIHAHLRGATLVDAADISVTAIQNTKKNFEIFNMSQSSVFHSDVFTSIPKKMYDVVIFNLPYHDAMPKNELEQGVMDSSYKTLENFFANVTEYLSKDGEIYISFSRSGNINVLLRHINKNNLVITEMVEQNCWNDSRYSGEDGKYNVQVYRIIRKEADPLMQLEKILPKVSISVPCKVGTNVVVDGEFQIKLENKEDVEYSAVPLCLIRKGTISILENNKAIKHLGSGEFFGLFETAYYLAFNEKKIFGSWTLIASDDLELSVYTKSQIDLLPDFVKGIVLSIGRKSEQPQPLSELPDLDSFVHTVDTQALPDQVIVFHSHLLESNYSLIKHLAAIVGYDNVFVLEKPYSTVDRIFKKITRLGVHTFPLKIEIEMPYDFSVRRNVEYVWDQVATHCAKKNIKRVTVVSDGADMLLSVPWSDLEGVFVGALEQTQNGIDKLRQSQKRLPPVVNIATSHLKKEYESPFIATAIMNKIKKLGLLKGDMRFGVVGGGSIGASIRKQLKEVGINCLIYDTTNKESSNVISLEYLIHSSDVIIGTTGKDALRGLFTERIAGNKFFISASSSNREFQYLFDLTKTYPNFFQETILKITPTFSAQIFNGGYPINFDRQKEREPQADISLTRMLLFAGFLQASCFLGVEKGIIELDKAYEETILFLWRKNKTT